MPDTKASLPQEKKSESATIFTINEIYNMWPFAEMFFPFSLCDSSSSAATALNSSTLKGGFWE